MKLKLFSILGIRIGPNRVLRWEVPIILVSLIIIIVGIARCSREEDPQTNTTQEEEAPKVELLYGFDRAEYEIEEGAVGKGESLSIILDGHTSASMAYKIASETKPLYNFNKMKEGDKWAVFKQTDSLGTHLKHFVYEVNSLEMLFVDIEGAEISSRIEKKEQVLVRRKATAVIESSLWNSLVAQNIPGALAVEMENIYGWSVDFFGLQVGDTFTVVFDEKYIDGKSVGVGRVWGSVFTHGGKDIYAIPFYQGGTVSYWDEKGQSMKRQFLKAPLKFTRISSKFDHNRLHPIYKTRRPHLGVDYAAPTGTPVVAIADGTVTAKYWDKKGGGNVLKLKHANGYTSSYLHLSKYAKGIKVGSRVTQGETICYVGNTGASTGPHLDFRVYKNGTAIDPLKLPTTSVEPINKGNMANFEKIRDKVMAELAGDVAPEMQIDEYDLNPKLTRPEKVYTKADSVRMRAEKNTFIEAVKALK